MSYQPPHKVLALNTLLLVFHFESWIVPLIQMYSQCTDNATAAWTENCP